MAQRYRDPIAHARMAADTCPECGQPAGQHSTSPNFWERGFGQCDLLPAGVRERIDQYRADTEETRADAEVAFPAQVEAWELMDREWGTEAAP